MFQVFTVLAAVAEPITRQFTDKQFDEYTAAIRAIYKPQIASAVWSVAFWWFFVGLLVPISVAAILYEIIVYRRTERRLRDLEARAHDHDRSASQ